MQKYVLLWNDIKDIIKNKGGKPFSDFVKDNMTIEFSTDDAIPLGEVLKFDIVVLLRSVMEKDFDYYPQIYLEKCKLKPVV